MADVAQGQAAQQGVAQGVDGHVPVRMGDAADGTVYPDASQPQRQSLRQGMDVISVTDFDFFHTSNITLF